MSNLIEIQTQIEKLTKQASEIRAREFDKTVQEILAKMTAFGITLKDLQPKKAGKAAKPAKGRPRKSAVSAPKKSGTVVAAKYRGPNGESWSGRGLMPRWLSALVAQGKTKEDFAIKS
ncbi:MAG: hypothetical protein RLZZ401_1879 [Pseudomonadota bacterium]